MRHQPHTHALQMGIDITGVVFVVEFIWIYCDCIDADVYADVTVCLDSVARAVW